MYRGSVQLLIRVENIVAKGEIYGSMYYLSDAEFDVCLKSISLVNMLKIKIKMLSLAANNIESGETAWLAWL